MMKYPSSCFFQIMGGIIRINSVPLVCLFRLDNMAYAEIKSIIQKLFNILTRYPLVQAKFLTKLVTAATFQVETKAKQGMQNIELGKNAFPTSRKEVLPLFCCKLHELCALLANISDNYVLPRPGIQG